MRPFLWERFAPEGHLSDQYREASGALQALRRGAHAEPGSAPEMWPYYTRLTKGGKLTTSLRTEHVCLVTYGFHQQSISYSAHQPAVSFGRALNALRNAGAHSESAIDAHVQQLASAQQAAELAHHLRAIVQLMRATKKPIGFNYTQLFHDLVSLQQESQAGRVRRRWGSAYYFIDDQTTTHQE